MVAARLTSVLLSATMLALAAPAVPAPTREVHPQRWPAAMSPQLVEAATERRITALMARMSLEEKVGQMIQADIETIKPEDLRTYPLGSILAGGNSGPFGNERAMAADWLRLVRGFREVSVENRAGHTPIPVIFGVDAVHGHNNVPGATIFPHNIALGAAHDPELVRRIGAATGEEVAATGIEWAFAPTLAVPQDVRWGRTYEGYSDGPEIVAAYAGPMVEGLQGSRTRPRIAATAKHFLADGGTSDGVDQGNAQVSEDDLIRVHVAGYPPAINAGVLTVMASYSSWRGQKMHGNRQLLTDVLKGRLGFQGFVIGDWNGHGQVPGAGFTRTRWPRRDQARSRWRGSTTRCAASCGSNTSSGCSTAAGPAKDASIGSAPPSTGRWRGRRCASHWCC
jgi:beta-glucosidase